MSKPLKKRKPIEERNTAILYSGGGLRGALGVGMSNTLISDMGWPIKAVRGVSTGSLTAVMLGMGTEYGLQALNDLYKGLTKTSDLFNEYPWWKKLAKLAFGGAAIADSRPLFELLLKMVDPVRLRESGIDVAVGVTNYNTKRFMQVHANQVGFALFMEYVWASTSIPVEFKGHFLRPNGAVGLDEGWCFDGGVMNMIPTLDGLIGNPDIDRIVVCLCNPLTLPRDEEKWDKILKNAIEGLNLSIHDNWTGDLKRMSKTVEKINSHVRAQTPGYENHREIDFLVLAPSIMPPVDSLKVDAGKIRQTINIGEQVAVGAVLDYYRRERQERN